MAQREGTRKSARFTFAANMKRFRKALGLSQERLADVCGLHRTYIGSVERGERNISIDNMEVIAVALKESVIRLLEPDEGSSKG
ncbi:MAG: helix-turn-helix transcriptional regulator [Holophagaceae bacterium]|nr:helix-turn-helix transcriptional regulator [Holophagaceae bacterium]